MKKYLRGQVANAIMLQTVPGVTRCVTTFTM